MNKWLLIAWIAVAVTGCKKDASQVEKINDALVGTWIVESNKIIYYDQTGQKEYEEVLEGSSIAQEISFMKNLKARIVGRNAEIFNTAYNLAEENKLIYIELFDAAVFDAQVWRISGLPATEMEWKAGFNNIKYEDKETGEIIEAPKAELTLKFNKK